MKNLLLLVVASLCYIGSFAQNTAAIPYFEDFSTEDGLADMLVIDANDDGRTWMYSDIVFDIRNRASEEVDADDWLLLPPMQFEEGKSYRLSFDARAVYMEYMERLEVKVGAGADVDDMTISLIPPTDILKRTRMSANIVVPATGIYRIGFHAISDAGAFRLSIDDIAVDSPMSAYRPGLVTEAAATAKAAGQLATTISFKAPVVTVGNTPLTAITTIDVMRDKALLHRFDNVNPGDLLQCEVEAIQGANNFDIIASNSEGAGDAYQLFHYAGDDYPLAPTNVRMRVENGKAIITWDAPTTGENGGYINPETLKYKILRRSDYNTVAKDFSGTEFVDETVMLTGRQRELYYSVFAVSAAGSSLDCGDSNRYTTGDPYELPFAESFAGFNYNYQFWGSINYGSRWGIDNVITYDNDGGAEKFSPQDPGDNSLLYTGKIAIDGTKNVLVTFYYYHVKNSDMLLEVMVNRDNTEFKTLKAFEFAEDKSQSGWKKAAVFVDPMNCEYLQIGWRATAGMIQSVTMLDNIVIEYVPGVDLGVEMEHPQSGADGQSMLITALVTNRGAMAVEGAKVHFFRNGELQESRPCGDIALGQVCELSFATRFAADANGMCTFRFDLEAAGDDNLANNSISRKVPKRAPRLPRPEQLGGCVDGSTVVLNWAAPRMEGAITDDIEDYTPFAITEIGDWITVDNDRKSTFKIIEPVVDEDNEQISYNTLEYPNAGMPMAFQVFNAAKAGSASAEGCAFSGEQCLACFNAVQGPNDDWIISPELSGEAQTITFRAKSGGDSMWGQEKLEVYANTELSSPADFEALTDVIAIPNDAWTLVEAEIPAGARHFAIHCVSHESMVLFIDDVTFEPAPTVAQLVGYNVYRDNMLVNPQPVAATSFTDSGVSGGEVYTVRAVYNHGESPASNSIAVSDMSGVPTVAAEATDAEPRWYNLQGIEVDITGAAPGIYIRRQGNTAAKTRIK